MATADNREQQYAAEQSYTPSHTQQSLQNANNSVILVTSDFDRSIYFWEALSGVYRRKIQLKLRLNRLCISPDKSLLAAAGSGAVILFDVNTCTEIQRVCCNKPLQRSPYIFTAIGFHCDGQWIFTADEEGYLKVWDIRARELRNTCTMANGSPINDAVIHSNQAELITCDQTGSVKIWDLSSSSCTHVLTPEEGISMQSVTIAPDGSLLVAVNNQGRAFAWKMSQHSTVELVLQWQAHNDYILRCMLSPNSKLLATCSADKTVKIWNAEDFRLIRTLVGHQKWVWDCAFSADSAYLVTASTDHLALLWELSQGEWIRQYNHVKAAVCVALNDRSVGYM